jgi:mono/diheme cytochrome c family protein
VAQPVVNRFRAEDDFGFPSEPPRLSAGKAVFQQHCAACHAPAFWQSAKVQADLAYTTPIDLYLLLSRGERPEVQVATGERRPVLPAKHPRFGPDKLTRDERWQAIFYARHLAGASDMHYTTLDGKKLNRDDIASVFGANCAVCHGKEGYGTGPLHTGHPSSHGDLAAGKVHEGLFQPPPANFHQYARLYNRTDAQLVRYIKQGIYPSAMPPWAGLYDKDRNFYFDDPMIWMMVRHVRSFAYNNDLPSEEPVPAGAIPAVQIPVAQAGALLNESVGGQTGPGGQMDLHPKTPVPAAVAPSAAEIKQADTQASPANAPAAGRNKPARQAGHPASHHHHH